MAQPRKTQKSDLDKLTRAFIARRLQLQLTQAELALLAGVGRSTVQALESGRTAIQSDSATAIADALGCDVTLVTRAGSVVDPDESS